MPHDPFYTSRRWRAVRTKAVERDLYQCQECKTLAPSHMLHVDHIRERSDGGAAYDLKNLRTLCRSCHSSKTLREAAWRRRDAPFELEDEPDEMGLRWALEPEEKQRRKFNR